MIIFFQFLGSLYKITFRNSPELGHVSGVANAVAQYVKRFFRINRLGVGYAHRTLGQDLSPHNLSILWA